MGNCFLLIQVLLKVKGIQLSRDQNLQFMHLASVSVDKSYA